MARLGRMAGYLPWGNFELFSCYGDREAITKGPALNASEPKSKDLLSRVVNYKMDVPSAEKEPVEIPVVIMSTRKIFGREEALCKPVGGKGSFWALLKSRTRGRKRLKSTLNLNPIT